MLTIVTKPLLKYLRTAGGVYEAIGDYSGGATEFFIGPPANEDWKIRSLTLQFTFTGAQLVWADYASIVGGLTNGILIDKYSDGAKDYSIIDDIPLQTNDHLTHWIGDEFTIVAFSTNINSVLVHFNMNNSIDSPMILKGATSDQLIVTLEDNFSTLSDHNFIARGSIAI